MPFNGAELAWNSVDVRGDDGLLHNGRVINAVDGGLVVDFLGTGNSGSKLIPLNQVYYRDYAAGLCCDQGEVEVLLRLQPQEPWKWYPGTVLEAFGLVSVALPEYQARGVVLGQRFRPTSLEEDLVCLEIDEGRFLTKLVAVPSEKGAAYPGDDQLMAMFDAYCRQHGYWMMATQVHNNPHDADGIIKKLAILGIFSHDDDDDFNGPCLPFHECIQPLDELLLSLLKNGADHAESLRFLSPATPNPDGHIQSLYRDRSIFPQIFQCLTTIQQCKIRGVCAHWDAILKSVYIRRVLTVSHPNDGQDYTSVFQFAQCLYNCWTEPTRVLVLCGSKSTPEWGWFDAPLGSTARLLQRIVTEKGLPAAEMVILAREWNFEYGVDNWVDDLCKVLVSVAGICQQLVLKNVGIHVKQYFVRFEPLFSPAYVDPLRIIIRYSDRRITRQLTASDFLVLVNNGLYEMNDNDMDRLTEWIHAAPDILRMKIAQILNFIHFLDPRNGKRTNQSSNAPYGEGNLNNVDARQLTNLALHTLVQLAHAEAEVCLSDND